MLQQRLQNHVRYANSQGNKEEAAFENDTYTFKNEEHKQFVSGIYSRVKEGLGDTFSQEFEGLEKMSLEKINEKVDLIINKIEGLFVKEGTEVEMINKSEAESTIQAEIEELRGAYEFQLELKEEAVKLANQNLEEKETEISNLKNSFEENLKDLTEKVERLEAVETKAVKEEDVVQEAAPESNPFDGFAEKLRV